jgi:hypothetical protein
VRLAPRDRVVEEVEMGDAVLVGLGDLAIEDQLMPAAASVLKGALKAAVRS